MAELPRWAREYLDRNLPGNPVLNGRSVSRRVVLANTREGAVLLRRPLLGRIRHAFVESPRERLAMRCRGCGHNLQFYNLKLPAVVYCSICAAKYAINREGEVTDAAGTVVPAERHTHAAMCACRQDGCCADGCDAAACCPKEACECCMEASMEVGSAAAGGERGRETSKPATFRHHDYALYRRDVATKTGTRPLYFFSKHTPKSGQAVALPAGYEVGVSSRTGLPFLRRSGRGAKATGSKPATRRD